MRNGWMQFTALYLLVAGNALGMDLLWTRPTGQFPVEVAPLWTDLNGDARNELLILNRGGQILHWDDQGNPVGAGQDGCLHQLPEGVWASPLSRVRTHLGDLIITCNQDGLVVALSPSSEVAWTHQLAGKPQYGRAVPAIVDSASGTHLYYSDTAGHLTCLDLEGKARFDVDLGMGPCRTAPCLFPSIDGNRLLIGAGPHLISVVPETGRIDWSVELGEPILSRPEVVQWGEEVQIVCGAGKGSLFGLSVDGKVRWEVPIGDEIDTSITQVPRLDGPPVILFTGVWGNLHAVDWDGRLLWTSLFESKNRARPLVVDGDHNGEVEIYIPTYSHRVYSFDADGDFLDEARLTGIINGAVVAIEDSTGTSTNVLALSAASMAYRLAAGNPLGPYRNPGLAEGVEVSFHQPRQNNWGGGLVLPRIMVRNPNGAAVRVRSIFQDSNGRVVKWGYLSVLSDGERPLPYPVSEGQWVYEIEVIDADGKVCARNEGKIETPAPVDRPKTADSFQIVPAEPYATEESPLGGAPPVVRVSPLYRGEVDQGAFTLINPATRTFEARITLDPLVPESGESFKGHVTPRRVVFVDTVNGERVGDALPPIGTSGIVTIPSGSPLKVWLTVAAGDASPGIYRSTIRVTPLAADISSVTAAFEVEVVDLKLRSPLSMPLCTWDYVPNNWFPEPSKPTLDDMAMHGVRVFPRTNCLPEATCDPEGRLTLKWQPVDQELDRLQGRGTLLIHMHLPPITFPESFPEKSIHDARIQYLRELRDHLAGKGWDPSEYLFYPVDEPGYDFGKRVIPFMESALLLKEADPAFRIYANPVMALSQADFDRMDPVVDIWAPNMRLASGALCGDPRIMQMGDRERPVWSYECLAQVKSLSPLRYNRSVAWRAKFFGLSGIGLWTHCTTPNDPWFRGQNINDEYALLYPGDEPIPSVRWEALRDGIEDIAAVEILESFIERAKAQPDLADVADAASKLIRIALNDALELSDKAFIESRDYLPLGRRRLWHTNLDVERMESFRRRVAEASLELVQALN